MYSNLQWAWGRQVAPRSYTGGGFQGRQEWAVPVLTRVGPVSQNPATHKLRFYLAPNVMIMFCCYVPNEICAFQMWRRM